jgi:hypothetical protein
MPTLHAQPVSATPIFSTPCQMGQVGPMWGYLPGPAQLPLQPPGAVPWATPGNAQQTPATPPQATQQPQPQTPSACAGIPPAEPPSTPAAQPRPSAPTETAQPAQTRPAAPPATPRPEPGSDDWWAAQVAPQCPAPPWWGWGRPYFTKNGQHFCARRCSRLACPYGQPCNMKVADPEWDNHNRHACSMCHANGF